MLLLLSDGHSLLKRNYRSDLCYKGAVKTPQDNYAEEPLHFLQLSKPSIC